MRLYPNLYLMLVAGTTIYLKSTTYKLAEQVARDAIQHMLMPTPGLEVNHTQRIAHVAQHRRASTKAVRKESVNRYFEALAKDIASGEWGDLPGIGEVQIMQEQADGMLTFGKDGRRIKRRVTHRLRTKLRLYARFKQQCR